MDAHHALTGTTYGEKEMETDVVLTIEEAARRLRIGRTNMYALVMSGEVKSVTIGRLRRVPVRCLSEYIDNLLAGPVDVRTAA